MTTNSLTCHIPLVVSLLLVVIACDVRAFVVPGSPSRSLKLSSSSVHRSSTTQLAFGFFPSSSDKDDSKDDKKKKNSNAEEPKLQKKSVGLKGLVQLITAGAGAPFLGDFEVCDCLLLSCTALWWKIPPKSCDVCHQKKDILCGGTTFSKFSYC
jgi:hypothetical protein